MNDNLNNLKSKTEEALQQLFVCLQENQTCNEILKLEEKIDLLLQNTNEILRQNKEIISLTNEVLNNQNKVPFYETNFKKESTDFKKDFTETPPYFEEKQTKENESVTKESEEVKKEEETKKEESISLEQQIVQTHKEIEELQRQREEAQKAELTVEEEPKEEEKPQEQQKTSSVLEFLHKRVIKDKTTEDIKEQQNEESPQPSAIRNLTEQIKAEAKQSSEKKPRSIAEQFEDRTNKDLLSAIGVSEKFMFINDLFSGSIKDYTEFINDLNSKADLQTSLSQMEMMQKQKKWAKTSLAYTTLENIITKRFE